MDFGSPTAITLVLAGQPELRELTAYHRLLGQFEDGLEEKVGWPGRSRRGLDPEAFEDRHALTRPAAEKPEPRD